MLEIRKGIEEIKGNARESYGKVTIYNGFPYNFYDLKKTVFDASEQALSKALLEAILGKESADEMRRYYPKISRAFSTEFNEKIIREIAMSGALERFPSQQFSQALRNDFIALLKQRFPEIKKTEDVVDYVLDNSVGYGVIASLLRDPELEEIMVNSPRFPVFVFHRKSGMCKTNIEVTGEELVEKLAQKIAITIDKKFDADNPLLDARLPDGSRVNATFKLVSPRGFSLTIRKFTEVPYSVVDLIGNGTLTAELAAFLWVMVEGFNIEPMNIIVTGGSCSGKTTTLNALATFIRHSDRIVSIEDTLELDLGSRENWVPLESKPAIASKAVISMDDLLKNAMRMRPDRIIVGEVRGEEAQTLFTAMDTGHQGALTGDAQIQLSNGNILPISALAEKYFSKCKINVGDGFEFVEPPVKIQTISFNKKNFCLEPKPITRIWRRKANEKLLKINLKSGKSITLTKDHPLYRIDNSVQQVNAQTLNAGDFIAVPAKICAGIEKATVAEPYLAGLIYGDGYINENSIQFVNCNKELVGSFAESIKTISGNKISVKDYGSYSRAQVWDKGICSFLQGEYNIPFGNKTKIFKLNEKLLSSENQQLALFLRGMFDCEASVNLHSNGIIFSTSNPDMAIKMPLMLLRFGITSGTYVAEKDGKGNNGPYYTIQIYGFDNLVSFYQNIGFNHGKKTEKLRQLIKRAGRHTALLPNMGKVIKQIRKDSGLTQQQLSEKMGYKSRGVIKAYENGQRNPTKEFILEFCGIFGNGLANELKILAEQPINWQQVKSIKETEYGDFVYDLTVEDNHTYIANGFVISNCMGTLHSNSAREMLLRLQAKPMNVPESMLTLLNLVLVQYKMYSKVKGPIRRIAQVAELTRMDEKVLLSNVFEWERKKDKIERTNVPSNIIEFLAEKAGMTKNELKREMLVRQRILEWLLLHNIKKNEEVEQMIQQYYLDPDSILEEVLKEI